MNDCDCCGEEYKVELTEYKGEYLCEDCLEFVKEEEE